MNYFEIFGNTAEKTRRLLNIRSADSKIRSEIAAKTGLKDFTSYQRFVTDEYFDSHSEEVVQENDYPVATIIERDGKIEIYDHHLGKTVPLEQNPFISYNDTAIMTRPFRKSKKEALYKQHSKEMTIDWFRKAKNNSFQPEIVNLIYWRDGTVWVYNYSSSYDGAVIGIRGYSNARYVGDGHLHKCRIIGPFLTEHKMSKPLSVNLTKGTPKMSRIGRALTGMTMSMVYQGKDMGLDDTLVSETVKSSFEEGLAALIGKRKKIRKLSGQAFDEMEDYMYGQLCDAPPFKDFVEQLMSHWVI